jgi:hypothetical protein
MFGTLPPGLDTADIAHEDDPLNDGFDVKVKPEPMEEAMPGARFVLCIVEIKS